MCRLSGRSFIRNIWASRSPNDRDGCLQDSHWSGGAFGYFPSYALGSAYGAQMLRRMEQDVDVWGAAAKGDLTPITAWLREKGPPVRRADGAGRRGEERLRRPFSAAGLYPST